MSTKMINLTVAIVPALVFGSDETKSNEGEITICGYVGKKKVTRSMARQSEFFANQLADENQDEDGDEVQLFAPGVDSNTLEKIVDFMYQNQGETAMKEIARPLTGATLLEQIGEQRWYADYIESITANQEDLFQLITAANQLNMPDLLNLGCAQVASMIKGKTTEEIKKTFSITDYQLGETAMFQGKKCKIVFVGEFTDDQSQQMYVIAQEGAAEETVNGSDLVKIQKPKEEDAPAAKFSKDDKVQFNTEDVQFKGKKGKINTIFAWDGEEEERKYDVSYTKDDGKGGFKRFTESDLQLIGNAADDLIQEFLADDKVNTTDGRTGIIRVVDGENFSVEFQGEAALVTFQKSELTKAQ